MAQKFKLKPFFLKTQRRVHVDQPPGGGGRAGRPGGGGPRPGAPGDQRRPGGAPPGGRDSGGGGPGHGAHQLQGREAEDAPQGRVPGRPGIHGIFLL